MTEPTDSPVLATISPSAPRRFMGITVLSILGGLLVYLGLANPPADLIWQLFLLVLGAVTLWLAEALRRATAHDLELTAEELRETSGRVVVRVADVTRVDRGTFAIKPSNGFVVRLRASMDEGNRWAPGLWWRLGPRVGVGGITAAAQTKAVAEMLTALAVAASQADAD